MESPVAAAAEDVMAPVLTEELICLILERLPTADLLRAAVVCHRWCGAASLALPRMAPLLGYFVHPDDPPPPSSFMSTEDKVHYPAVFVPLDASSPRLSLSFASPGGLSLQDVHLGLVLLVPCSRPMDRILVVDPASRRSDLLPPLPHGALPEDVKRTKHVIGAAILSRSHRSRLCFKAVCVTIDGDRPRAWIATYGDGDCIWSAAPQSGEIKINSESMFIERHCVHAAGNIYWHICNSGRLLVLNIHTLEFSFLLAPSRLGDHFHKYRIGEIPEDGRLCIASAEDQQLQLWVRGDGKSSDNGWVLTKKICMRTVYDTVPGLRSDLANRTFFTWLSDIDAGHTGKVFIKTCGYGRYSFHVETGDLERLVTDDGKEYGHPIYAYFLDWPPAFLAPSSS